MRRPLVGIASSGGLLDTRRDARPGILGGPAASASPFAAVIALGGWRILVDAKTGMAGAAGNLTSVTDQSGNALAVGLTGVPKYNATAWNGTEPAMLLDDGATQGITATLGANTAQPFGMFVLFERYVSPVGGGQANIMTITSPGGTNYLAELIASANVAKAYAGAVLISTIPCVGDGVTESAKTLFVVNFNGAGSAAFNGTTAKGAADAGAFGWSVGDWWGLGKERRAVGGHDMITVRIAAAGVRNGLFSAGDRTALRNALAAMYTGVPA